MRVLQRLKRDSAEEGGPQGPTRSGLVTTTDLLATSGRVLLAADRRALRTPPLRKQLPVPGKRRVLVSHFTADAVSRLIERQVGGSWRGQTLPHGTRRRNCRLQDGLRHRVRNPAEPDRCTRRPSASDQRRVWTRRRSMATTTTPLERTQRSPSTCFIGGHRDRTTRAASEPICACASRR